MSYNTQELSEICVSSLEASKWNHISFWKYVNTLKKAFFWPLAASKISKVEKPDPFYISSSPINLRFSLVEKIIGKSF